MKKLYLIISILALITTLTGIPYLIEGITLRGLTGVNYGRILFPIFISIFSFRSYKNNKH